MVNNNVDSSENKTIDSEIIDNNRSSDSLDNESNQDELNEKVAIETNYVQWYEKNPELQEAEIKIMKEQLPNAKMGYLSNGNMYWAVTVNLDVRGKKKEWTLLAVYDSDHPQQRWGNSVKIYPVQPNYSEMTQMVKDSCVSPKTVPHVVMDKNGEYYVDTFVKLKDGQIATAFSHLQAATRWIWIFETARADQKMWSNFIGHYVIQDDELTEALNTNANDVNVQPVEQDSYSENLSLRTRLDAWIKKSPVIRKEEVEYLQTFNPEMTITISDDGSLHKPFSVGQYTFMMVLDKTFPKKTEASEAPIKVYLVIPTRDELQNQLDLESVPNLKKDSEGLDCLDFPSTERDFDDFCSGRYTDEKFTERMIKNTNDWVTNMAKLFESHAKQKKKWWSDILAPFWGTTEKNNACKSRSKYSDARQVVGGTTNTRCKKIILSDRAYAQIFTETFSKIRTETGGLLLGHFDKGIWYVVEASDPGINATFTSSYHEGDDVYENHVCEVISRMYKHPLVFLGMWHRHPGSLDVFSGTDDRTNYKYTESAGNGCISALINVDPDFRITFYYVERGDFQDQVFYTKVDVEIGNDKFENQEILKLVSLTNNNNSNNNGGNHGK